MLFQPVQVCGSRARSGLLSVALHALAAALVFTAATNRDVQQAARRTVTLISEPLLAPYVPAPQAAKRGGGGGGGGDGSVLPASRGRLPRAAPRQFTPPMAVVHNDAPKLVMEPTIVVDPRVALPVVNLAQFGDPFAKPGPPSNGPGSGGGIGSGDGGGVGSGKGPGVGPGEGGGFGGGTPGGRGQITPAALVWKVEPEYTDEARKARVSGMVAIVAEIGVDGRAHNLRVTSSLGLGLDEKAIEAVRRWKFRPGYRDGVPVATSALIQVTFHLL